MLPDRECRRLRPAGCLLQPSGELRDHGAWSCVPSPFRSSRSVLVDTHWKRRRCRHWVVVTLQGCVAHHDSGPGMAVPSGIGRRRNGSPARFTPTERTVKITVSRRRLCWRVFGWGNGPPLYVRLGGRTAAVCSAGVSTRGLSPQSNCAITGTWSDAPLPLRSSRSI